MSLSPGARLGPYEVISSIGAGGMGEVYCGRDTRLDRSVAIKVLPHAFASDPDRRIRFEREARVVAGLSHPNICALHDVGVTPLPSGDDVSYLVMEHLEGETLDHRIARGSLTVDETIRYAVDIARGLDAAHRQRVVHRDLKPSNIMITRSGVKLLDFGLAKAIEPAGQSAAGSTIAATAVTAPGTVLGTVPYMAPEQIEGKAVDARADIFAFGCVIYEMASGRRAFAGESPAAVASAILATDPPMLTASPGLDALVRGCLRKDPEGRWQSAHDIALQLEAVREAHGRDGRSTPRPAPRSYLPWLVAAASLALAVVAVLAGWFGAGQPNSAPGTSQQPVALTIAPPPDARFSTFVEYSFVSVSPDGAAVAYVVVAPPRSQPVVWVRELSSTEARIVPGTEGVISTFWSPDSRSLGFFAEGKLKRVKLSGGAPVTLCDVPIGTGLTGTWGATGEILYSAVTGNNIMRVPDSGGQPQIAMTPDVVKNSSRVALPAFLPDGRRYLFLAGGGADHVGAIMLGSLDAPPIELMRQQSMAHYVEPGFLVFVQDSGLVARRFDPATARLSGTPVSIAPRVNWLHSTGVGQFSASLSGVIAFLPHVDEGRIASFDRTGRELAEVRPVGSYQSLRVSPDGREMLYDSFDPSVASFDVWLLELLRGGEQRLTSHIGSDISATWMPGGGFLYTASRGGPPRLHLRRSITAEETPLFDTSGNMQIFPDVAPDGRHVVFAERGENGAFQLMWMTMKERRAHRLHSGVHVPETAPRFSPSGKLLAYASNITGRREVYVESFPPSGDRRTVSIGGGNLPRWSRDGGELFYVSDRGEVKVARVSGSPLEVSTPATLFERRGPYAWADFDVTADGRFFAHVPLKVAAEQPFTVLVNWPSLVKP